MPDAVTPEVDSELNETEQVMEAVEAGLKAGLEWSAIAKKVGMFQADTDDEGMDLYLAFLEGGQKRLLLQQRTAETAALFGAAANSIDRVQEKKATVPVKRSMRKGSIGDVIVGSVEGEFSSTELIRQNLGVNMALGHEDVNLLGLVASPTHVNPALRAMYAQMQAQNLFGAAVVTEPGDLPADGDPEWNLVASQLSWEPFAGQTLQLTDLIPTSTLNTIHFTWNEVISQTGPTNWRRKEAADAEQVSFATDTPERRITAGAMYIDVDRQLMDASPDPRAAVNDAFNEQYRRNTSHEGVNGDGDDPMQLGFGALSGGGLVEDESFDNDNVSDAAAIDSFLTAHRTAEDGLGDNGFPGSLLALHPRVWGDLAYYRDSNGNFPFKALPSGALQPITDIPMVRIRHSFDDVTYSTGAHASDLYGIMTDFSRCNHYINQIEIMVDPYTQAQKRLIRFYMNVWSGLRIPRRAAVALLKTAQNL